MSLSDSIYGADDAPTAPDGPPAGAKVGAKLKCGPLTPFCGQLAEKLGVGFPTIVSKCESFGTGLG